MILNNRRKLLIWRFLNRINCTIGSLLQTSNDHFTIIKRSGTGDEQGLRVRRFYQTGEYYQGPSDQGSRESGICALLDVK